MVRKLRRLHVTLRSRTASRCLNSKPLRERGSRLLSRWQSFKGSKVKIHHIPQVCSFVEYFTFTLAKSTGSDTLIRSTPYGRYEHQEGAEPRSGASSRQKPVVT